MTGDPSGWPLLLACAVMRPFAFLVLLPLAAALPQAGLLRAALALALALPVLPLLAAGPACLPPGEVLPVLLRELMIGVVLGFAAAVPFWALETTAGWVDTLRGASMGGVFHPALAGEASQTGVLFLQGLLALMAAGGGLHALLDGFYASYRLWPFCKATVLPGSPVAVLALWRALFDLALALACPAFILMLLVDLVLGFAGRSNGGLDVFFLGMPLKSLLVFAWMALAMAWLMAPAEAWFDGFVRRLA